MKKNNTFPILYPDINDNMSSIESKYTIIRIKEIQDSLTVNGAKMLQFFQQLTQSTSKVSIEAVPIISKFIKHSKLMEKVETEYGNEKKQTLSLTVLCTLCASLLQFKELKKGEILFRINDIGDKFYFVIDGLLSLLKPKDISKVKMTYDHYLRYLLHLKKKDEMYILQEIMKKNYGQLPIDTLDELMQLYRIVFINTVKSALNQKNFGLKGLEDLFKTFDYTYADFGFHSELLIKLWCNKVQRLLNAETEWEKFISKRFKLSASESAFYERYPQLINEKDAIKEWTCSQLEIIVYFSNGAFFGDNALDSSAKKRFGTVRVDKDSLVAYMKESDYITLIAPNRKKQKAKDISFLNDNFFLRNINSHFFEKHYYHQYTLHNYTKNHMLFESGSIPRELIFLQEGKVEIKIRCSVVDLHNMIKYLIDEISKLPFFVQGSVRYPPILPRGKIAELKQYLRDSVLTTMKSRSESFIQDMNTIRSFQLFILAPNEVIGIEEMILKIPYLASAKVITVNGTFFKLEGDNLQTIISEEKSNFYAYSKMAANKLLSLIERLYHLKTTSVELALFKGKQNEELMLQKAEALTSNNINNNNSEVISKLYIIPEGKSTSPKKINIKEKIAMNLFKEEEKSKSYQSSARKLKKANKERRFDHIIFSNPKIAIDTAYRGNHYNMNVDVSSQYTNFDDKIITIQEKDFNNNSTFIDFKNKLVSLSQLQQEIEDFSSVDESQNLIQVVAKKCNYEMLFNTSKYNYSRYNHKDDNIKDENYKAMQIAELAHSNFPLSYVPLFNKKFTSITPFNSPRQMLSPIKYDQLTDRGVGNGLRQSSLIEADKIPFIAKLKKKAQYFKGLQSRQQCNTLKSLNNNSQNSNSNNEANLNHVILDNSSKDFHDDKGGKKNIIPDIVKNYYQSIKNSGYSFFVNSPHNTYIKKKIQSIKCNSNSTNASVKKLRISRSTNELSKDY